MFLNKWSQKYGFRFKWWIKDGVIETATLKRLYRDSYDAPSLNIEIGNKENLNFDEFFEIMRKNMLEKKK